MSFFDSLDSEKYDRNYTDRALFKRILSYFRPQVKRLVLLGSLILVGSMLGASLPILVSRGVDMLDVRAALATSFVIPFAILLVGCLIWGTNWARRRLLMRAVAELVYNLAIDAFSASCEHDLSFYDEYSSGKVVSRITSDTRDFGNLISLSTDLITEIFEAVFLGIVLFNIDRKLTLYVLLIIPVVVLFTIGFRTLARKVTRQGMRAMANVNATIKETVSGISIAKNFRQEASIYSEFVEANTLSYNVNVQRGIVLALVFPTLNAIGGVASALMVYYGGMNAAIGAVTAGSWYLFIMSLDRFMFPVMNLASFWTQVQTGLSAAERVFALIDAEPAVTQVEEINVPKLKGEIRFEKVNFSYRSGEPILSDFSLHIHPGENIAFVGHTGAGKSSIAKLISRFYEFQGGMIKIDELDIRRLNLNQYRRQLGIVSQVPFLFSGTVAENIRYACPEADEGEIEHIGRKIGNGEWIDTLSNGLETQVGERGANLSMGQRQLVALTRVLVQKPVIFVLDEATASIDPFTEWQIQQALNLILQNTTSILIAHRLSTVKSVDRIIVIEKGKIIESGNHDTLLGKGGHYAELYNTYFRHQSLEYIEHARDMVK